VSDVVEGNGVVEWIAVGGATRRVVAVPVDTRLIHVVIRRRRPVVGRRGRVAAGPVQDVGQ